MKTPITILTLITAASVANGAVIASFDFGKGTVETDFTQVTKNNAATGVTAGGITVTYDASDLGDADRGGISDSAPLFTYNRVLASLLQSHGEYDALKPTINVANLTITGLDSMLTYQVQIWSHDRVYNSGAVYTFVSATTGASGSVTNANNPSYPDNDAFSFKTAEITGVTSITWETRLTAPGAGGSSRFKLNGLQVTTVPEPGSAALLLLGALGLLRRKRD